MTTSFPSNIRPNPVSSTLPPPPLGTDTQSVYENRGQVLGARLNELEVLVKNRKTEAIDALFQRSVKDLARVFSAAKTTLQTKEEKNYTEIQQANKTLALKCAQLRYGSMD